MVESTDFYSFVVNNLLKVRDRLGYELADSYIEEEGNPEQAVAPFNDYTECEMLELVGKLIDLFPGVIWDSENVADALYCSILDVGTLFRKNL